MTFDLCLFSRMPLACWGITHQIQKNETPMRAYTVANNGICQHNFGIIFTLGN